LSTRTEEESVDDREHSSAQPDAQTESKNHSDCEHRIALESSRAVVEILKNGLQQSGWIHSARPPKDDDGDLA
jgi:hypothetical protein